MDEIRKVITIDVTGKIATQINQEKIVCGNSDYVIEFTFDEEWDDYEIKTARFTYKLNGKNVYKETVFSGSECKVPMLSNITEVEVGVYTGDITTTTPAKIVCLKSILCSTTTHEDPEEDVYVQLLNLLRDNYPVDIALQAAEELKKLEQVKSGIDQLVNEYTQIYLNMQNHFVSKTGDTMTGSLMLPGETPLYANEAAQKWYVDKSAPKIKIGYYDGDDKIPTEEKPKRIDLGFKARVVFLIDLSNMDSTFNFSLQSMCFNNPDEDAVNFILYHNVNYGHFAKGRFDDTGFSWWPQNKWFNYLSNVDDLKAEATGAGIVTKESEASAQSMYNSKQNFYMYIAIGEPDESTQLSYANFDIDVPSGTLKMITPDNYEAAQIEINEDGYVEVTENA